LFYTRDVPNRKLSRAAAIATIGAMAVAGVAGYEGARLWHGRHGCIETPALPTDGVRIVSATYRSRYIRGPVGVAFAYRTGVDPRTIGRVVYLLPGRGGSALGMLHLNYAAALATSPSPAVLLASIDPGESYFHARASGENRLAAVTDELPGVVERLTGARPLRAAIGGVSMGGYGALLAAQQYPHRFVAVSVAGPAIFLSYADERASVGDASDSAADFARNDVIAHAARLGSLPLRIRYGSGDPFGPGIRRFAAAHVNADVAMLPGCHDDGFWRSDAPDAIGFLTRSLA